LGYRRRSRYVVMNSRQSAHGGSNVPRMKPTGKTFFVSERHKALHRSTVNLLLHTCSKAAALPFLSHPHMLRHACGFALADQGADTRLIQDCLGNRGATLPFMSALGKIHLAVLSHSAQDAGGHAIRDCGSERERYFNLRAG
jgi:integrase